MLATLGDCKQIVKVFDIYRKHNLTLQRLSTLRMATNKISFGFNKTSKKTNLIFAKPEQPKKIELVECLEEHSIKIKE